MHRLTEALAEELAGSSVTVNAVLPSIIDTPANRADMPKADPKRWVAPTALADVILFLASDRARFEMMPDADGPLENLAAVGGALAGSALSPAPSRWAFGSSRITRRGRSKRMRARPMRRSIPLGPTASTSCRPDR